MNNDKLRAAATRILHKLDLPWNNYADKESGGVEIILAELTPLFPAPAPVDDKALAEAIERLDSGDTSCLLTDSVEVLAQALRAAQLEAKELRATNDGPWNMISNIADTLRARGFEEGQVDERVIAMAQALDKARDSQQEVAELRKDKERLLNVIKALCQRAVVITKHKDVAQHGGYLHELALGLDYCVTQARTHIAEVKDQEARAAGEGRGAT